MKRIDSLVARLHAAIVCRSRSISEKGQGTTEYAILVGVLAVIAMIAIAAFRGRISELWEAITSGVNGL